LSTRIVIADDHEIVRAGLRALLEKEPGLEVVGEADNGRDAVRLACDLTPHMVVMDASMPDMNGVEATRLIAEQVPSVRVIALSMHTERRFVLGMLDAGAMGYVVKDCALDELVQAIEAVGSGESYISPRVAGIVLQEYKGHTAAVAGGAPELTGREKEILQLIAEGLSSKDIAARLHVSAKTIETHRRNLMDKLNIRNVAQLTRYAIREGLTSAD
jgi:two-component system response regulator NreC